MLDKNFDFAEAEKRLYEAWEKAGAFKPSGKGEPFTIVIPPPNVTGNLHMGHALNNTLQDVLCRFERMRGRSVLWQPGTDHAGIATQMVVERQLNERQQKRTDFSREEFIEKVWEWRHESGGAILNQLKRLGATCDWSRERFTMGDNGEPDDQMVKAVMKVFVDLYNEGLIYRDKRLVNWDPKFETAISDLEVENTEVDGAMWHFKYPLAGGETYDYVEKDEDGNVTLRETRDYISIATTRPETMLGDGAVAVHPSDERYAPIVGKLCEIPAGPKEHRRLIPIITDEYPDPDFGSGAVKITGAHDFNDYQVAKRGGIPMYRLMGWKGELREDGAPYAEEAEKAKALLDADGTPDANYVDGINLVPDEYRGLDRFEARDRIVADIDADGLMIKVEDKKIMQPFGDRSGVVIEPMLTDQWFADAKTLAEPAIAAVEQGDTKFTPENWEKTYFQWMRNIEPWCISRQLWWGHRIPAYYAADIKPVVAATEEGAINKIVQIYNEIEEDEFPGKARTYSAEDFFLTDDTTAIDTYLNSEGGADFTKKPIPIERDPDVLDTWFSSALWPFSTLGWPDADNGGAASPPSLGGVVAAWAGGGDGAETPSVSASGLDTSPINGGGEAPDQTNLLDKHYPTSVLVTAFDIIFFWVARMMMMGTHFMKDVPFPEVLIHGLVVDEKGQKMSKSKGNGVDPLALIDRFGADAVRFTLAAQAAHGRNARISDARVEGYRNFSTKLWNAARFAQMNECGPVAGFDPASAKLTLNRWIIHEANACASAVTRELEARRFNDASGAIYKFTWNVFCDWYLELAKPVFQGDDEAAKAETRAAAAFALGQILKLLHPFMPFVSEELWNKLGYDGHLITSPWPQANAALENPAAAEEMQWAIDLITSIRSVRQEMNVPVAAKIMVWAMAPDKKTTNRLRGHQEALKRLARLEAVAENPESIIPKGAVQIVHDNITYGLILTDVIDVDSEKDRLAKEQAKAEKEIAAIDKKLANKNFIDKAPAKVVEEQKSRRESYAAELEKLNAAMKRLEDL
ncbi:MAG: valine--tRNA ligase [Pseudomonadota bacterium]